MIFSMALAMAMLLPAAEDPTFDDFFRDFTQKREHIRILEAKFTQKTILPDEIISTEGRLLFAQPRRIVIRMTDPDRTTLVDHRQGYEYDSEVQQLLVYSMEDNPRADIFFLGFDNDTENLRRAYDVSVFTVLDDDRGSKGIRILPKPEQRDGAYFVEVSLYLRDSDYLPYRIHIINDEETQVFLDVRDITVNGAVSPEKTQIALAEGTKIIEDDMVRETVGEGGKKIPEAIDTAALLKGESVPEPEPEAEAAPLVESVTLPAPEISSGETP